MEPFSFGRTFSRAFALMRASFGSVGIFVLVFGAVAGGLNLLLRQQLALSIAQANADGPAPLAIFGSAWYWLILAIGLVIGTAQWTGAMSGMLTLARGGTPTFGECLSAGLRLFAPALGLMILWGLGVGLGWILLFVPGIILMTMWSAALPALVDGSGVIASFGRSRALTKGSRWTIFGLLLVSLVILYLPILVIGGVVGFGAAAGAPGVLSSAFYLVMIPYGWLATLYLSALLTSIYLEGVTTKEGGGGDNLGEVFA